MTPPASDEAVLQAARHVPNAFVAPTSMFMPMIVHRRVVVIHAFVVHTLVHPVVRGFQRQLHFAESIGVRARGDRIDVRHGTFDLAQHLDRVFLTIHRLVAA